MTSSSGSSELAPPSALTFQCAALSQCSSSAGAPRLQALPHERASVTSIVATALLETCGRLGSEGQALLQRLRRSCLDYGRRRPGRGGPVGLNLRRLRVRLEATLLREVSDTALLALGCRSTLALGWATAAQAAEAYAAQDGGGAAARDSLSGEGRG